MHWKPLPPELAREDAKDREVWSVQAAKAVAMNLDDLGLLTLVALGEDEFCRVARAEFAGQCFHTEDFKRMFQILAFQAADLMHLQDRVAHG